MRRPTSIPRFETLAFRSVVVVFFLICSVVFSARTAAAASPRTDPISHVIIVTVDGLMPATHASPDAHGLQVPTFRELVRNGAWSDGVLSVFPTVTYPAHTSIATGTNPGTHGIVSNVAFDPLGKNDRGWRWYTEDIRAPTLWDSARARGLTTALVWWPVTVGAQATAVLPEIWRAGSDDDAKLLRAMATPGLLDSVGKKFPNFRAGFTPPGIKDEALTDIAAHLIESLRPHLLMLHIAQVDHEQHEHGPFSPKALAAVENADRQVARLIAAAKTAGIWSQTVLVVASDHGFAAISQQVRPGILLAKKGLVTLNKRNRVIDWKAAIASAAGQAYIYLKDPKDAAAAKTVLEIFEPLAGSPGSGIQRIYRQEEIRRKGGDASAYLALEGAEGFTIIDGYAGSYVSSSTQAGTHGYDPERSDMRASLLVYGPSIVPGKINGARLIDIAPTVATWLSLRMDKAEGRPLPVRLRSKDAVK
jgi:predicted AlkP superfamily pyrophosphatase or phosphodiesterase